MGRPGRARSADGPAPTAGSDRPEPRPALLAGERPRRRTRRSAPGGARQRHDPGARGDRARVRRGLRRVPGWARCLAIPCVAIAMTVSVASDPIAFLHDATWD